MIRHYISIARPDHWFKNVFAIPGTAVAVFADPSLPISWLDLLLAYGGLCITASSNYVINELIDGPRDREHPVKSKRPVAAGLVSAKVAIAEWLVLGVIGVAMGAAVNGATGLVLAWLWVMGVLYNVPPIRLKDRPYFDVLSESVNNPIRFLLGWYAVSTTLVAPISVLLAYWMLGAYLMAIKRLAEYREIDDPVRAAAYRSSFRHYDANRLLVSIMFYATAFALFGGLFIMRYRIELALSVPLVAGFLAAYLHLGLQPNSPTQYPEQLYKQKGFFLYTAFTFAVMLALLYLDVPQLEPALHPTIPPR